jgi:hypothetical protein
MTAKCHSRTLLITAVIFRLALAGTKPAAQLKRKVKLLPLSVSAREDLSPAACQEQAKDQNKQQMTAAVTNRQ